VISAYAEDAVLVAAGQPVGQNRRQIDNLLRNFFRLKPTVRVSRVLSRTLAPGIVLSVWRYTTMIGLRSHTASCAVVWRLEGSNWRILLHASAPG
jgi:hypothetical protein